MTTIHLHHALDALSMHGFRPRDGFDGEDWEELSGPREALALLGKPGARIRLERSQGESVTLELCPEGGIEDYTCSSAGAEYLADSALWSAGR